MGPGSVGMGLLAGAHRVPRRASSAIFGHLPRSPPIHIARAVGSPRSRLHPRDTSWYLCVHKHVCGRKKCLKSTPHQAPGAFEVAWSSAVRFWTMELGS